MRILLSAAAALPLFLTSAGFAILPATPSMALPQQIVCTITTYYNNADFDEAVGTRTRCPGSPVQTSGRTTRYYTSEQVTLDQGGGGHHTSGGGSLPCEFLQAGCSNLPVSRFGRL